MAVLLALLALVAVLLLLLLVSFTWNFDYWRKRGVPYTNPYAVFGDEGGAVISFREQWKLYEKTYKRNKDKRFVGVFQLNKPVLLIIDPELTKSILTKEFSSFQGRGQQPVDEENDPFSANLFNLEGNKWKNLRAKLSPTFTSGKLKLMFPLMRDISDQLTAHLADKAAKKEETEFRDLLTRYATDVIGSVAFGIDCNSLKGEGEFHTMTREIFKASWKNIVKFLFIILKPKFIKFFTFGSLFGRATDFFVHLMKDTVEYRETNKIERNDFVNLMMQLRESDRHELDRINHIEFNHNVMAAQAFLFFLAGLDNIANTVGFALHELALNPELQERAAEEARAMVAKHDGMTYEAVRNMDLIERIIRETLRKWTPVGLLSRQPSHPVKIPDTDVVLDSKCIMWIPIWQMHHDPDIFPDPERFDPERFTEEAKEQRHAYTYLPFGEGPRFCIAERFAVLEMKLCLASLLSKYQVSVGPKTATAIKLDPKSFNPVPKGDFWLQVEDRP